MVTAIQPAFGLVILIIIALGLSENRQAFSWRWPLVGISLQITLALMFLYLPIFSDLLQALNLMVQAVAEATKTGTSFVFGYLGGGDTPFATIAPQNSFVLAFQALPQLLVFSVIAALLWHWRLLQPVVNGMSWVLQKSMGVGGAVGVGAAANVFVGMVEAPLLVKPYLEKLDRGELFMVMSCGMATVAGTVLVLYASVLADTIPNALGQLLIASLISAPAALMFAKIMVPSENRSSGYTDAQTMQYSNTMDAITTGTQTGLQLLLQVIATLLVLVALVSLVNQGLSFLPQLHDQAWSLQRILGWLFAPLVWLIGIPWHEAHTAGALMGSKTVLNELIAYIEMSQLDSEQLSDRSRLIMTYALCGFANLGSLGILLGGMTSLLPHRRQEIIQLAPKTLISGTLATMATGACIALIY